MTHAFMAHSTGLHPCRPRFGAGRAAKVLVIGALLAAALGCAGSDRDVDHLVRKYAEPPADIPWAMVGDTEEFWQDVDVLHRASLEGHREALRTLLVIGTFTDGAVSQGMPDLEDVVRRHPGLAREIILGDARLRARYAHWVQ